MIRPMSPGSIEVVSRAGAVLGRGFVWVDDKEVRQEWVFERDYEWPPFGVAEFRPAAVAFQGLDAWRADCVARWTDDCTFVRALVERQDQIYPEPWMTQLCVLISEGLVVGVAFAELQGGQAMAHGESLSGAVRGAQGEAAGQSAPIRFRARETWLTTSEYKPPPLAVVRIGPYSTDLFAPVGATHRDVLEQIQRSDRHTRTVVRCTAYSAIPF